MAKCAARGQPRPSTAAPLPTLLARAPRLLPAPHVARWPALTPVPSPVGCAFDRVPAAAAAAAAAARQIPPKVYASGIWCAAAYLP